MNSVSLIKDLFIHSGVGWVLWTLFGLFGLNVVIFLERLLYFFRRSENTNRLAALLDTTISRGGREEALSAFRGRRSVGASVAATGLLLYDRGLKAAEMAMQSAVIIERKALESRLGIIGTLANNAPFVGLLGTVIGIVLAFDALGSGSQAGGLASEELMLAISEALVATAVGIGVALPAVVTYNYLQRRLAEIICDAEALSRLVVAYLADESRMQDERSR